MAVWLSSACAPPGLLAPDDRKQVCRVGIVEKFGSPALQKNPLLSDPATGAATGAAGGAAVGVLAALPNAIFGPAIFVLVPVMAVTGASYGAVCGAISVKHPHAEANFETTLKSVDAAVLRHALERSLRERQPECGRVPAGAAATAAVDTVIEIESVGAMMECSSDAQKYMVAVQWRVVGATTGRWIAKATTGCRVRSFADVDAWFGDPDRSRLELERVLAWIGGRMGAELHSPDRLPVCSLRALETGEIAQD